MAMRSDVADSGVAAAIANVISANRNPAPAFRRAGRKLTGRVQMGFRRGVDPYGVPWQPVLRGGQPLVNRGRFRRSFQPRVEGAGESAALIIGTNFKPAPVHQYGAVIKAKNHPFLTFRVGGRWVKKKQVTIPARPMLPDSVRGLPPAWSRDLITELNREAGLLGA